MQPIPPRSERTAAASSPSWAPPSAEACSALPAAEPPQDTSFTGAEAIDQALLGRSVEAVIAKTPQLASADWALVVADEQGKVLYEHGADQPLAPASSLKVVTGAAASSLLGSNARFTTHLSTDGTVDAQGTLHGNLYLVGGGDPTLTSADLREAVRGLGLARIDGNVVVDDQVFDDVRVGRGWSPDDLDMPYGAECDGLMLDADLSGLRITSRGISAVPDIGYLDIVNLTRPGATTAVDVSRQPGTNTVEVRGTVSSSQPLDTAITVHEPALYAGAALKGLLEGAGIGVSGHVTKGSAPAAARALWSHDSPTLHDIETTMLKQSNNLYAESLFHALAHGDSAAAPAIEQATLGLEATPDSQIVDGSGLSRLDRITARQLDKVVQTQYRGAEAQAMLPISGVDGTLKNRMQALRGLVHAKTGTMHGVSSLVGWLAIPGGHALSFAWVANGFSGPARDIKVAEDTLVQSIYDTARGAASSQAPSPDLTAPTA